MAAARFPCVSIAKSKASDSETLEARLRARGTDDELTIQTRLANAQREIEFSERYDYQIVNDDLDRAVDDLASLLHRLGCGGPERDA